MDTLRQPIHLHYFDLDVDVVELTAALSELSDDVVGEPDALAAVVKQASATVLLIDVERRGQHLRIAEAHRLVEVIDAVQEVAVVPPGRTHDRVVPVVRPVLDEALSEVFHVGVDVAVAHHLRQRVRELHHHVVAVPFVRRERDVLQSGVLEDARPAVGPV